MPVLSIFSGNPALRQQAGKLIQELARGQPDTLRADCFDDFHDFLASADGKNRRILLLAQEGPEGAELASETRERFPDHRFIWFSDLDFALFSYRLEAAYFGLLPLTEDKMRTALRNCAHQLRPPIPAQAELAEKPVAESRPPTILGRIIKTIQFSGFF